MEFTGTDGGIGLIARSADQNHFYLLQLKQYRKTYGWFIHRKDGDTWVDLASGSFPWVANHQYDLRFSLQGSALTAAISADGGATFTTLGTVDDSTYTSGRIGGRACRDHCSSAHRPVSGGSQGGSSLRTGLGCRLK